MECVAPSERSEHWTVEVGYWHDAGMKLLAITMLTILAGVPAQRATELSFDSFDSLLAQIQPTEAEQGWQGIAWRLSLAAAVVESQAVDKPILLWAMNGHPLGCV